MYIDIQIPGIQGRALVLLELKFCIRVEIVGIRIRPSRNKPQIIQAFLLYHTGPYREKAGLDPTFKKRIQILTVLIPIKTKILIPCNRNLKLRTKHFFCLYSKNCCQIMNIFYRDPFSILIYSFGSGSSSDCDKDQYALRDKGSNHAREIAIVSNKMVYNH